MRKHPSFEVLPKGKFRKKVFKYVDIDFSSREKIRKAEKEKAKLENQGYIFAGSKQTGFDKFRSVYIKAKKRKLKEMS